MLKKRSLIVLLTVLSVFFFCDLLMAKGGDSDSKGQGQKTQEEVDANKGQKADAAVDDKSEKQKQQGKSEDKGQSADKTSEKEMTKDQAQDKQQQQKKQQLQKKQQQQKKQQLQKKEQSKKQTKDQKKDQTKNQSKDQEKNTDKVIKDKNGQAQAGEEGTEEATEEATENAADSTRVDGSGKIIKLEESEEAPGTYKLPDSSYIQHQNAYAIQTENGLYLPYNLQEKYMVEDLDIVFSADVVTRSSAFTGISIRKIRSDENLEDEAVESEETADEGLIIQEEKPRDDQKGGKLTDDF